MFVNFIGFTLAKRVFGKREYYEDTGETIAVNPMQIKSVERIPNNGVGRPATRLNMGDAESDIVVIGSFIEVVERINKELK